MIDSSLMSQIKKSLNDSFKIKDLELHLYFLGIEVLYSSAGVFILQKKYTTDIYLK